MPTLSRPFATLALLALPLLGLAAPARAAITFTTSTTAFAAGSAGVTLANQTFAGEGVSTNGSRIIGSTLSQSNDSNILPGLTFSTSDGTLLYLIGPNGNTFYNPGATNTNTVLSTYNYEVPISLSFALPQTAVSLNLLGINNSGTTQAPTIVTVISTTGVFLANYSFLPSISGTGSFLGILATAGTQIGSINVSVPGAAGSLSNAVNIDSVRFRAGINPAVSAPEPGSVTLLGIGLAGLGLAGARSRRRAGA